MANDNALLDEEVNIEEDSSQTFDYDELQAKLQEEFAEMDFLREEGEKINNPDVLGEVMLNVVWEQFQNQVAMVAGDDFIKENHGLCLDLSDEAHVLSPERFETGKLPTHNFENKEKYEQRYTETRADFQTNPKKINMTTNMRYNEGTKTYERYDAKQDAWVGKTRYNEKTGTWEDYEVRTGKWEKKLAETARTNFDTRTKNEKGTKTVHKDHVISAAEQIRDMEAAAYMDRKDRQDFAKSDVNIQDLDSSANQSKGALSTEDWLNTPRKDGQSQAEYFGLDEEELRKRDKEAREAYKKEKEIAKKKAIDEGRKSQKDEAFRIGGKALQAVVMMLLGDLAKQVIRKLIKWLKSANKSLKTLLSGLKDAIIEFIHNLKNQVLNVADSALTTIFRASGKPLLDTIKKRG